MLTGQAAREEVARRLEAHDAAWLRDYARSGDLSVLDGSLLISPFTLLPIRSLVARNETLTSEQHEFIGAWAMAALWKDGMTRIGLDVIATYRKAGRPFPADKVLQSFRLSLTSNRQQLTSDLRSEILTFMARGYWAHLDAITLELLYRHLGHDDGWAERLIQHPVAAGHSSLHLLHVRRWEGEPGLLRYTALDEVSYLHPEIRTRIRDSGDGVLIALMSAHATGTEFLHAARSLPGDKGVIPAFYAALPTEKKEALPATVIAGWLERIEDREDRLRLQTMIFGHARDRPGRRSANDRTVARPQATDPRE